jgi:hypothetical protein
MSILRSIAASLSLAGAAIIHTKPVQADIISFQVNATSTNTTPVTEDGIIYPANTPATLYFDNVDTVKRTGTCWETLSTSAGVVTTLQESNVILGLSATGATYSAIDVGGGYSPLSVGFDIWALSSEVAPGFNLDASAASWEELFAYVDANAPYTQYGSSAQTSDNSPDFAIDSITMDSVPEPLSAGLLGVAGVGLLARRCRRQPAMNGL